MPQRKSTVKHVWMWTSPSCPPRLEKTTEGIIFDHDGTEEETISLSNNLEQRKKGREALPTNVWARSERIEQAVVDPLITRL